MASQIFWVGDRGCGQPTGPSALPPQKLQWKVADSVAKGIKDATARFDADTGAMDLKVWSLPPRPCAELARVACARAGPRPMCRVGPCRMCPCWPASHVPRWPVSHVPVLARVPCAALARVPCARAGPCRMCRVGPCC